MSLPRPLENNNQHNLNLSESCPVQADHLMSTAELERWAKELTAKVVGVMKEKWMGSAL